MTDIKTIESGKYLIVVFGEKQPCVIEKPSKKYDQAKNFLSSADRQGLIEFLFPAKGVEKYTEGHVEGDIDGLKIKGEPCPKAIADRILKFKAQGLPYQPLLNFWEKLKKNPSESSRKELLLFLEYNQMPLLPDGCFLAYKKVYMDAQGHYLDCYSKKISNDIRSKPKMDRKDVDANRKVTCSNGLHVAAYRYAKFEYGNTNDVLVICKVDPVNVVSVPEDYNNQKMRVCEYEVISIGDKEIPDLFYSWDLVRMQRKFSERKQAAQIRKSKTPKKTPAKADGIVDLRKLSGRQIIDKIADLVDQVIPFSPKSKRSIIKKAKELLKAAEIKFKI